MGVNDEKISMKNLSQVTEKDLKFSFANQVEILMEKEKIGQKSKNHKKMENRERDLNFLAGYSHRNI